MTKLSRSVAAWMVGGLMAAVSMPALAEQSLGLWRTDDGTMDYELTLCGDGTQLCGTLVALHGRGDNARNQKYLGTKVFDRLKATGNNKWSGTVTLVKYTANGDVTIDGSNVLHIKGCAYLVVCADISLQPVQP
jgi:uncharacterized protein (DUF2147 family)